MLVHIDATNTPRTLPQARLFRSIHTDIERVSSYKQDSRVTKTFSKISSNICNSGVEKGFASVHDMDLGMSSSRRKGFRYAWISGVEKIRKFLGTLNTRNEERAEEVSYLICVSNISLAEELADRNTIIHVQAM